MTRKKIGMWKPLYIIQYIESVFRTLIFKQINFLRCPTWYFATEQVPVINDNYALLVLNLSIKK